MSDFTPSVWEKAGGRRRLALLALVILPSLFASEVMYALLPGQGLMGLNLLVTVLFGVLFGWISVGFWSSLAGLFVLLRRYDGFKVTLGCGEAIPAGVRTALLFPVYHEDMAKVGEGIRATLRSLKATGQMDSFDTFILSDSTRADNWVLEEEAWHRLCEEEGLQGRLFYRRRKANLKRKSGNIADFCRRWGLDYKYMIVFDADSLMAGETLARMVTAMEAHPEIGILQTPPKVVLSRTCLARLQQFANHLYGPIFAAGLHFWQLGDAQYWGHNAIIRLAPFVAHCALPILPGRAPLGGEILSHDFVESAMMRRAGYGVWLAYELGGSYEQSPPNLIDELARDRRWCQGNLQHSKLITARGFFPTHRALFINGIMSYGSALLWLFFLLASSFQALSLLLTTPDYFPADLPSLFPEFPQYFPSWALTLLSSTATLLFLPKAMAVIWVTARGGAKAFGGFWRMALSVLLEVACSTFLAPVRMVFHSYFVLATILGAKVGWNAQNRDESGTRWGEALACHWWGAAVGLLWGALMLFFSPGFFLWLSPVVLGLAISIPLSVWTSRVSVGQALKRAGLLLTPAETAPAKEIAGYGKGLQKREAEPAEGPAGGFARAVVRPRTMALHLRLAQSGRHDTPARREALARLEEKALAGGPGALSNRERHAILASPRALKDLHFKVWALEGAAAGRWGL